MADMNNTNVCKNINLIQGLEVILLTLIYAQFGFQIVPCGQSHDMHQIIVAVYDATWKYDCPYNSYEIIRYFLKSKRCTYAHLFQVKTFQTNVSQPGPCCIKRFHK
jgi:hypothetical protein